MAVFGASRLQERPGYLATVRKSGAPRVHPVTPIITSDGSQAAGYEPEETTCYSSSRSARRVARPTEMSPWLMPRSSAALLPARSRWSHPSLQR
jgi:hypothetical protein